MWWLLAVVVLIVLLLGVVVLEPLEGDLVEPDEVAGPWPYVVIFGLIFGDAIVPVLPGETTLNAASTLAAQGVLELGWVMVAGAAGAVLGDSGLYWIARLSRSRVEHQLEAAMAHGKVTAAMEVIGSTSATLLVFGRYVPGMRFVVNATLGLAGHPYRDFVRWSALGGILWSIYICTVAYLVGTTLADSPLLSLVVSAVASSVAVAVVFVVLARRIRRRRAAERAAPGDPTASPGDPRGVRRAGSADVDPPPGPRERAHGDRQPE